MQAPKLVTGNARFWAAAAEVFPEAAIKRLGSQDHECA